MPLEWPSDGRWLLLQDAIWHILDRATIDRELAKAGFGQDALGLAFRAALIRERLKDTMMNGGFESTGCEGSPTGPEKKFQNSAWRWFDVTDWGVSIVYHHDRSGIPIFNVHVRPLTVSESVVSPTASASVVTPVAPDKPVFQDILECRKWIYTNFPMEKLEETGKEYGMRTAKIAADCGFPGENPETMRVEWYAFKRQREKEEQESHNGKQ
jgi:hypothetical protein